MKLYFCFIVASRSRTRHHNYIHSFVESIARGELRCEGEQLKRNICIHSEWMRIRYISVPSFYERNILFWFHQHCGECSARYCVASSPPCRPVLCQEMLCYFALGLVYVPSWIGRPRGPTNWHQRSKRKTRKGKKKDISLFGRCCCWCNRSTHFRFIHVKITYK